MNNRKYLIVIAGPTAIGKTATSIKIAQHYKCEIISCDSRQFYKEMRVGTAVPSEEELSIIKHHFIHHKSIHDNYTVGDFERDAIARLDELFKKDDFAVLVGGSGLYLDAVLKGIDVFPEVSNSTREKIRENYEALGIGYLQHELERYDPNYYAQVDIQNPQRMMRALEVSLSSGQPYSTFLSGDDAKRNFTPIKIGLDASREIIYERINLRTDQMIADGLLAEAEELLAFRKINALQTVGYKELFQYFGGEISLDQAIEEIKKNTRRFAKRQLTWFKRDEETKWFDISADLSNIIDFINKKAS